MSSWYDWCNGFTRRRDHLRNYCHQKNENSVGIFFLPLILLLILVALFVKNQEAFTQSKRLMFGLSHMVSHCC